MSIGTQVPTLRRIFVPVFRVSVVSKAGKSIRKTGLKTTHRRHVPGLTFFRFLTHPQPLSSSNLSCSSLLPFLPHQQDVLFQGKQPITSDLNNMKHMQCILYNSLYQHDSTQCNHFKAKCVKFTKSNANNLLY